MIMVDTADTRKTEKLVIGYVRPDAPPYTMPAYGGRVYEDRVPDTLDIAEMARLALNGLGGPTDPDSDYELYFMVNFFRRPPVMIHDFGDGNVSKFMGPFVLNRLISGSMDRSDAENGLIMAYLKSMGTDNHYYPPIKGKPWINENMWTETQDPNFDPAKLPDYGGPGTFPSRMIEAFLLYYLRTGDPMWKKIIEDDLDLRIQALVDQGSWGYYGSPGKVPTGFLASDGWSIQALAQIHRVLKIGRALDLAKKLVIYQKDHAGIFDADGRFIFDQTFQPHRGGAHFHIHTNILLGFLEYAREAGDQEIIDFVNKSYLWARSEQAYSSALVGFFPENVKPDCPNTELCPVADMVDLAIMLSLAHAGDYWDDADRWIRNQFAEGQLTKIGWIDHLAQTVTPVAYNETSDHVAERNIGGFAGWPSANDWADRNGIQECCTGNAARTLYYIWENILQSNGGELNHDGELKVNLLLNRASPWADVYSHVPYQGQVDVKTRRAFKKLAIRLPEWVKPEPGMVRAFISGQTCQYSVSGRYAVIPDVGEGQTVSLKFPISERTVQEKIGDRAYTLVIKGNTVVSIDPPGLNGPLYQNAHYHENETRWISRQRFVSDEQIIW
jgi:hypothetical protein